jgi:hypothetical protein
MGLKKHAHIVLHVCVPFCNGNEVQVTNSE